ncbi:MAG: manganese efflux pump [candidate division WOR-3 bacterium]|nr:MAG: manganese efflux pump [candidate division WOR-3 bacterium]
MNLTVSLLLALSLAFDAFAVSVSCGIAAKDSKTSGALMVAGFFGAFQFGMPLVGWVIGSVFEPIVASVDHWFAFVLLCSIGIHMIFEAAKPERRQHHVPSLNIRVLSILAVATSIDALVAGFGFAFMRVAILQTVATIGVVTFVLSAIGYYIGDSVGSFFKDKVRFLGGVILIGIGVKILIEHLS